MKKMNGLFLNYCIGIMLLLFLPLLLEDTNSVCAISNSYLKHGKEAVGKDRSGAYYTGVYPNLFEECLGISRQQTDERVEQVWEHFFVKDATKVYFESDDHTAYIIQIPG